MLEPRLQHLIRSAASSTASKLIPVTFVQAEATIAATRGWPRASPPHCNFCAPRRARMGPEFHEADVPFTWLDDGRTDWCLPTPPTTAPYILKIREAKLDFVYINPAGTDQTTFLKQYKEYNITFPVAGGVMDTVPFWAAGIDADLRPLAEPLVPPPHAAGLRAPPGTGASSRCPRARRCGRATRTGPADRGPGMRPPGFLLTVRPVI